MPYDFGTNHAQFFESGNSWPKFWTVQNFWAQFPIDLRIARTHYGLCESVKIFTNWVRLSHESKYLSIRVWGLCGIGALRNFVKVAYFYTLYFHAIRSWIIETQSTFLNWQFIIKSLSDSVFCGLRYERRFHLLRQLFCKRTTHWKKVARPCIHRSVHFIHVFVNLMDR